MDEHRGKYLEVKLKISGFFWTWLIILFISVLGFSISPRLSVDSDEKKLLFFGMMAIGILFFFLWIRKKLAVKFLLAKGIPTTGKIQKIYSKKTSSYRAKEGNTTYYFDWSYEVDGKKYKHKSKYSALFSVFNSRTIAALGASDEGYPKRGKEVSILYHPRFPEKAIIAYQAEKGPSASET